MITNLSAVLPSIVETLNGSSFKFHLTGSRYFGGVKVESDWDLFIEESEEVIQFLSSIGFEMDFESFYDDPSVIAVYYGYCIHHDRRVKVDVQLVSNAELKLEVQRVLQQCWPSGMSHFDKLTSRAIWKVALEVAKQK